MTSGTPLHIYLPHILVAKLRSYVKEQRALGKTIKIGDVIGEALTLFFEKEHIDKNPKPE